MWACVIEQTGKWGQAKKALRKWMHSSGQPEAAVITYCHTLSNPAIITKYFKKCSISNDLDGTEDYIYYIRMFSEANGDDKFLGF